MTEKRRSDSHVYGIHSAVSMLSTSPRRVRRVLLASGFRGKRLMAVRDLATQNQVRTKIVPRNNLDRIAAGEPHQGVILEIDTFELRTEHEFERAFEEWDAPLILALDGIQDPRNLGACLRTAEGAGVDAVLLTKNRSAPITDVVHRTSTGALDSVFLVGVSNLVRRLDWLKQNGCWVTGTSNDVEVGYTEVDFKVASVLVVGGEEKGMRQLTASKCDHLVSIPMLGDVESLNVAVATGVLLYEAVRQRIQS